MNHDHEYLAEELKKLVGWGILSKRVPLMPTLRLVAGVGEEVPYQMAGSMIRRHLATSIDSLTGEYEFNGQLVPAEKLNRVYRLLFKIEGSGLKAPKRRERVIVKLGVLVAVDQWRKPDGLERELMLILADHMVSGEALQVSA